jgi:hypothetical protein
LRSVRLAEICAELRLQAPWGEDADAFAFHGDLAGVAQAREGVEERLVTRAPSETRTVLLMSSAI